MTASVEALADPVWDLIDAIEHVNTYDAEVPARPPADEDGRVHAYAVYYPSPGWAHALAVDAVPDSMQFSFQVTCAGGDRTRALWCVSQVRGALAGVWITVAGQQLQIVEETVTAPIRRDDDVKPPRMWAPLQFSIFAP